MMTKQTQGIPSEGLQIQSLVTKTGELRLSLHSVPVTTPCADEVLIRVEAAPISPSDLVLLLGPSDMSTVSLSGSEKSPVITATVPNQFMPGLAARVGLPMPVGNEGGGVVIQAGTSEEAQALLGKVVGFTGGASFSQFRTINASQCLGLDSTAKQAAASFINPLTSQAMVEIMKRENHSALVNTAAASSLGQMLQKICLADGIDLVNIVRSQKQVDLLKSLGAKYVYNSNEVSFERDLTDAMEATGATLAFDATGGGKLIGQILNSMESAVNRNITAYNRYGSDVYKKVYVYGGLDRAPTVFNRGFGFNWGIEGFLIFPFLANLSKEDMQRLQQRIIDEIDTTFAMHFTKEISLAEALTLDALALYSKKATGEKYLINPFL